ncbi:hypothetical protein, variant [Exophiala mesophila]|uniref:Uncharacterized protein n=1 Tax=Exophiala mesophila TaxID=212818 RepID=A0A0D1Z772_EXOME|nr:hypothetical protein, variant [Exophiala mesophila]KIV89769.1 hypothetical protein, variant [Exophiala mesophila]
MELSSLVRRQYYDDGPGWWYSDTAYIIKWSVIAFLVIACLAFFLGAYLHARRRMAKGQPPLRYHRWLVPRRSRYAFAQAHPEHAHHFSFYRNARPGQYGYAPGQTYQMGHYGAPPPGKSSCYDEETDSICLGFDIDYGFSYSLSRTRIRACLHTCCAK